MKSKVFSQMPVLRGFFALVALKKVPAMPVVTTSPQTASALAVAPTSTFAETEDA